MKVRIVVYSLLAFALAGIAFYGVWRDAPLPWESAAVPAYVPRPGAQAQTIVLNPFLDRLGFHFSHRSLALQYLVAAELLQTYDCTVVSRHLGLSLGLDRGVAALRGAAPALPAADWRVGGAHVAGRVINSAGWREGDTELLCENLRTGQIDRQVLRNTAGETREAQAVAQAIAQTLNLPHRPPRAAAPPPEPEVWAVLPFPILERIADVDTPRTSAVTETVELALRESGRLRALVNRTQVFELLQEAKIAAVGMLAPGTLAAAGRLLQADAVVYGLVTAGDGGRQRLDLFLIDSTGGAIRHAVSVECRAAELAERGAELARQLAAAPLPSPAVAAATPTGTQPTAEVESRRATIRDAAAFIRTNGAISAQILSLAESCYLTIETDDQAVLELVGNLYDALLETPQENGDYLGAQPWLPALISAQQNENLYQLTRYMLDGLRQPERDGATAAALRFSLALRTGHFTAAAQALERLPDGDAAHWAPQRGLLAAGQGDWETAAAEFLSANDIPSAMQAILRTGDERRAWETGRRLAVFPCATAPAAAATFVGLEQRFDSTAAALRWLTQFQAGACSAAHRMRLKSAPALGLLEAELSLALGDKARAWQALQAINRVAAEAAFPRYAELSAQLQADPDAATHFMRPAAAVLQAYRPYKIYLQPLHQVPDAVLARAARLIQEQSGIACVILERRTVPTAECYDAGRHQWEAQATLKAARTMAGTLPADGVLFLAVLNDSIYAGSSPELRYVFLSRLPAAGALGILSLAHSGRSAENIAVAALRMLALFGTREFACSNPPCLMTSLYAGSLDRLEAVVCAACVAELQNLDAAMVNRLFQTGGPPP